MAVEKGNTVKVDYVGTLEDGTEFDNSQKHGHPLEFEVGSGKVIKGFDDAVMGMDVGAEKQFTLNPKEAYGEPDPNLIKNVPRDLLPKDQEPKVGMVLGIGLPSGQQVPATVTDVQDDHIMIDMNPPLAGKTLTFKIKVLQIQASS